MILRELLEGTSTQLWNASRTSSNALIHSPTQKNYTDLEESLGLGLKRGHLLGYMFR